MLHGQPRQVFLRVLKRGLMGTLDSRALGVISGVEDSNNDCVYEDGCMNMKKMISCVT